MSVDVGLRMSPLRTAIRTIGVSALTATLPFVVIALYWLLTWKHGDETAEGIVFNGAFLIYRLFVVLAGAGLVVYVRHRQNAPMRLVYVTVEGLLIGTGAILIMLTWNRAMSRYYLNWAEPGLVEVIYGIAVGITCGALAELFLAPMRRS